MSYELHIFRHREVQTVRHYSEAVAILAFDAACRQPETEVAVLYGPEGFINSYQKQAGG